MSKKGKLKSTIVAIEINEVSLSWQQILFTCLGFGILFFIYSYQSTGFYQDDEIGHFQRAQTFFENPLDHIGNWSKFGFKLIYSIPSLFGFQAVMVFNIFITIAGAFVAYLAAKEFKLSNAPLAAIFALLQPMLIDLSFRTYSELLTGLLFALLCLVYQRKNYLLTAFISSYLFMIRQETAIMSLILGGIFIYRKQLIPFFVLGFSPILLVILGFMKTGDWFYIFKDAYAAGVEAKFQRTGFEHYIIMLISIIGSIPFSLFLMGLFSFSFNSESNAPLVSRIKAAFEKYEILYLIFIPFFLFQCLSTSKFLDSGVNPGNLRYMACLYTIFGIFSLIGLNEILQHRSSKLPLIWMGAIGLFTLFFCSYQSNLFVYTNEPEYSKLLFVGIFFVIIYLYHTSAISLRFMMLSTLFCLLLSVPFLLSPLKLNSENKCIQTYTAWAKESYPERIWLTNHNLVQFFGGIRITDTTRVRSMRQADIAKAPIGSIILWDTHYGFRPEYKMDVAYEYFQKNERSFKLLQQFNSEDNRFICLAFEKIGEVPSP
ncbi:MAG: hypothetical protein SFU91_03855 [Chloroherpetonaceae bacterium]|nr:hypothetical protein [Chloroherpetonaceae bacterium]